MGTDAIDVSQIESMANLIYKLGPAVVILAVFLLLFLAIVLIILKSFMDNQKKTQEQNEALMKAILTNFESFKAEEEENKNASKNISYEKNIVEIFVKLNNTFKMDCKRYSEKIGCDRIGIYVFHNGTHSSHGLPFFKVSCISEWIRRGCGIGPHIKDCNAVPLSIFDDIIERIYSYGFVIVKNSYDRDIEPTLTNPTQIESSSFFLDRDKAKVAIFVAVYDSFENILAFIMAEYLNDIADPEIDADIAELREFCARIRPTLEFSDYNEIRKNGD